MTITYQLWRNGVMTITNAATALRLFCYPLGVMPTASHLVVSINGVPALAINDIGDIFAVNPDGTRGNAVASLKRLSSGRWRLEMGSGVTFHAGAERAIALVADGL